MPKRTKKQREASRANGRQSHGAVTPEGKARIVNANLWTGLFAEEQIVYWENQSEFDELREEYYTCHPPRSPEARCLVDQLVRCEWQLRRFAYIEQLLWSELCRTAPAGVCDVADALLTADTRFCRLQSRINATRRAFHQARKELEQLEARDADVVVVPKDPEVASESPASTPPTTSKQTGLPVLGSLRKNALTPPAPPAHPTLPAAAPVGDIINSKCEPSSPPSS